MEVDDEPQPPVSSGDEDKDYDPECEGDSSDDLWQGHQHNREKTMTTKISGKVERKPRALANSK